MVVVELATPVGPVLAALLTGHGAAENGALFCSRMVMVPDEVLVHRLEHSRKLGSWGAAGLETWGRGRISDQVKYTSES